MKEKDKRIVKGYKVADVYYKKAMRRSKKEKGALSKLVEAVVIAYAFGFNIKAHKKLQNGASALDMFSNIKGSAKNYIELHND